MPWCGFNQKMLEGLTAFHEGLVEHGIIERSKKKDQSTQKTIENEISDMDRFLEEVHNIQNPEFRDSIETLTKYAISFYNLIQTRGIDNYPQTVRSLGNFYFEMDRKFYADLEGKPEDMRQLVAHLNEISGGE